MARLAAPEIPTLMPSINPDVAKFLLDRCQALLPKDEALAASIPFLNDAWPEAQLKVLDQLALNTNDLQSAVPILLRRRSHSLPAVRPALFQVWRLVISTAMAWPM